MDDLIELVARALAAHDGYDPDETWQEFDRTAAHSGAPDSDVFRVFIRWKMYQYKAQAVLAAINRENVVVPRVATDGMLGKGGEALAITVQWQDSYETDADNCYEAMLRASPYYVEIQG